MNYGLPYMGSKNSIAEWVIRHLPKADNLYDLFCGGCAITHCALLTNKWQKIYANDIDPAPLQLFWDSANGKYHNDTRWISHEDFDRLKDTDPYVAYMWSFGNNPEKGYLYSKELEPIKHAMHDIIFFDDYTLADKLGLPFKHTTYTKTKDKRIDILRDIKKKRYGRQYSELQSLERLERLQSLERLERLESDTDIYRLNFTSLCYDAVPIKDNSVIYCDIPYKQTEEYKTNGFNHDAFYKWCCEQSQPIFISEYAMPPSLFEIVAETYKNNRLSAKRTFKVVERIYRPKTQL